MKTGSVNISIVGVRIGFRLFALLERTKKGCWFYGLDMMTKRGKQGLTCIGVLEDLVAFFFSVYLRG